MAHIKTQKSLIAIAVIFLATAAITVFLPPETSDYGVFSLYPAILLTAYIFVTERIVEALIVSAIVGFIMASRPVTVGDGSWLGNIFTKFSDSLLNVMMDEDIAWLIIVCGLMGSIISLIERAGGSFAFADWISSKVKTRKSTLLATWILGIVIFIDDYLNSLTVGSCMTPLTDKHKVSREYLSYIVDSTAAPLCVIIPISTWAVFCSKILESNGWAPEGEGMLYFIKTIPYNFYAWIAALIVPLTIYGVVPIFGALKKAEERVANGGPIAPPGSEKIDIKSGLSIEISVENPKMINLFLPIIILVVATLLFDIDMSKGVLFTLGFMFVSYLFQGVMTAEEFVDYSLDGIKNMLMPLLLMVLAFLFAEVNDEINFTYYVIDVATRYITPELLPFVVFIVLGFTQFITGTNWGMYIIALPIIIPLAMNVDANVTLAVASVLSAGVYGSHICFFSDATVITSSATGCSNFAHARTQMPYGMVSAAIASILFLIAGFVL